MVNNIAQLATGEYIRADNKLQRDKGYYCPSCKKLMFLVRSEIKKPHFRHKKGETCIWLKIHQKYMENGKVKKNIRESTIHKIMKEVIFSFFDDAEKEYYAEKEHKFDFGKITDVYVKDLNLAIECEYKHLNYNNMLEKIELYAKNNIRCLYVFYTEEDEKISSSKQKLLNFMNEYNGQVIFMNEKLELNVYPNKITFSDGKLRLKDRFECNKKCRKLAYLCPYCELTTDDEGRPYKACLCNNGKNIHRTYEMISYSNFREYNYEKVQFKE